MPHPTKLTAENLKIELLVDDCPFRLSELNLLTWPMIVHFVSLTSLT